MSTRRTSKAAAIVMALGMLGAGAACRGGGGGGGGGIGGGSDPYGRAGSYSVRVSQESVTTFYYPSNMESGRTYPIIIWGNGTITQPSWYDGLLRHWASHGFIVAAANTSNAGSGQEMLQGLDNLAQKNNQAGSPFYQKVALDKVAASGHSQGGAGTMRAAKDPRVKTAMPIEGPGDPTGVHGPVIFFAGQNDTALRDASLRAYQGLGSTPGAFAELAGASHLTPLGDGGGFRGATTAWAKWQLEGDTTARNQFVGQGCGLCNNRLWSRYMATANLQ